MFASFPVKTILKTDVHAPTHIYEYTHFYFNKSELFMSLIATVVLEQSRLEFWLVIYIFFS